MIADAFHSASDLLTDIGVLVGLKFLAKPPDSTHAYGHGRDGNRNISVNGMWF